MRINSFKKVSPLLILLPIACFSRSKDQSFTDLTREQRRIDALETKSEVATFDASKKIHSQHTNGDEERYEDLRGSFGVSLDHHSNGFIRTSAFEKLVK